MDCKQVMDNVLNIKPDNSGYDFLIQECRTILYVQNTCKIVFTRRQANKSLFSYAPLTAFDHIPYCISSILINEMV